MQQILCFFVAIFMFSFLFISSTKTLIEKQKSREAKQNLNTVGRELVNHAEEKDGRIKVDEKAYFEKVSSLNNSCEFVGAIFNYDDYIVAVKKNGNEILEKKVSAKQMNAENRRNTVNFLLRFLFQEKEREIFINIALENEADYLTKELFNKMEDNTVFIVGEVGDKIIVSGFELNTK